MAETPRDIQKRTVRIVGILIVVLGVVFFMIPAPVLAQETTLGRFVANLIFTAVISPVSALMDFLLYILVEVSQYNGFADAPIVTKGWTVLRDLSNMFFVLILLIIAISSIVKWQVVNYRQNLRRLILMALLINFSKTIVVFFIDLSQVITLTFISAVKDVLQAGVVTALGLDKMVSPISGGGVSGFAGDLFTYVVAAIAFCVATLVVAVILILFLGRIIALWLILVFAPLAFLASTLPQTKEWYDKWWKTLGSNLTLAPVLAFMLWLVFAVVAGGSTTGVTDGQIQISATGNAAAVGNASVGGIASSSLVGFLVAIGLLMYAIKLGVQMSTVGGSVAQKLVSGGYGLKTAGKRIWSGKSGEGGIKGRALTPLSATGARVARGVGLTRLSENLNIAQAERMEKRQAARRGALKYMDEATLERRATGMTTSFAERAEVRKEQMRRGAFTAGTDDRGQARQARSPEEMQKIYREIEMGRVGRAFGQKGTRGVNQEFIEKEMDITALPTEGAGRAGRFFKGAQSTEELQNLKQKGVLERIKSGKLSDEDLKDRMVQQGMKKIKTNREIGGILKDRSQDVIESWTTFIEDNINDIAKESSKEIIAGYERSGTPITSSMMKEAMVRGVDSPDNKEAASNRRLLATINKRDSLRASAHADVTRDGRVVLPARDAVTEHEQVITDFARTNLKELSPSAFSKLSKDQQTIAAVYLDSSKVNNFAQDEDVTPSQLREIFNAIADAARRPTTVPPALRDAVAATHKNLWERNSTIKDDYQKTVGGSPP